MNVCLQIQIFSSKAGPISHHDWTNAVMMDPERIDIVIYVLEMNDLFLTDKLHFESRCDEIEKGETWECDYRALGAWELMTTNWDYYGTWNQEESSLRQNVEHETLILLLNQVLWEASNRNSEPKSIKDQAWEHKRPNFRAKRV